MNPSRLRRYGVAVLSSELALLLRLLLGPAFAPSPFQFLFLAILLSAWYGGLGPGLLATLLSAINSFYFLAPSSLSPAGGEPIATLRFGLFVVAAMLLSWFISALTARAQVRSE